MSQGLRDAHGEPDYSRLVCKDSECCTRFGDIVSGPVILGRMFMCPSKLQKLKDSLGAELCEVNRAIAEMEALISE